MDNCESCGMPFVAPEDHALGDESSPYCVYCVDESGELRSKEEVHRGLANYYIEAEELDPDLASKRAEELMKTLPRWQAES